MGFLTDLLKEIPLSAVLRERLTAYEKSDTEKDAKIRALEAEVAALKAKVADLEGLLAAAHPKVAIPRNQRDECPHCGQPRGRQTGHRPGRPPDFITIDSYYCEGCGESYDQRKKT